MADADAYLEALGPPTLILGGITYVGKFLSMDQWTPFEPRIMRIQNQEADSAEMQKVIQDFCNEAFPVPWYELLKPWRQTVGEMVVALPPKVMVEVARDFFGSQARALGVVPGGAEFDALSPSPPSS